MTYTYIISIVDRLMPNKYSDEEKLRWMLKLDRDIWQQIIQTHLNLDGYAEPADNSSKPLVPDMFAEDVYVAYLQAQIAWHNEEDARYNRYITRFNDGYQRFVRWYNEHYTPIPRGEYWGF